MNTKWLEKNVRIWTREALFYVGFSYGKYKDARLSHVREISETLQFRWLMSYSCPKAAIEHRNTKFNYAHWLKDYTIYGNDPAILDIFGRWYKLTQAEIDITESIVSEFFPKIYIPKCSICNHRFRLERKDEVWYCENCIKVTNPKQNQNSGFVYIFGSTDTGYFKIGCSTYPENRLSNYQNTKLPFQVEMIHKFPVDDKYQAEAELHNIFNKQRSNGEWFELSSEDLQIITEIKSYQNGQFQK